MREFLKGWKGETLLIIGGILTFLFFGPPHLFAQVGVAPQISNISITQPTPTSTLLTWDTDIDADSEVNYGLDKNYGIARDPFPDKKHHSVEIDNLESAMTYHMRIGSADAMGNQALTGDYVITTNTILKKQDIDKIPVSERVYVERAIASIQQVKSAQGLQQIADAVNQQAEKELLAPVVSGTPHIDEVGSDYAIISWVTDQDAGSIVRYARDTEYDPQSDTPFTTNAGDESERAKDHQVRLVGLTPGTAYHFQADSKGDTGLTGVSRVGTFTTKAELPLVSGFRIIKAEADSVTLGWRTSIPASGNVQYTDLKTKEVQSVGSPVFATSHNLRISNLKLGARYSAIVKAENAVGDQVTSQPLFFQTVKDVSPPIISKVNVDSTLFPTDDVKIQSIASWNTDEPSFCQFFYREGLNPNTDPIGLGEEKDPRTDHVQVITDFLPSTVYQFWIECRDPSNNKSKSEFFVLFTPDKEKSIIDIIMENFSGTFGWVKNIGK